MGLDTGQHGQIMSALESRFRQAIQQQRRDWIAEKGIIGIQSPRGGRWDTVRIPDIVVMASDQWRRMADREAVVVLTDPPPILVVEVVSESTRRTDYRAKVSEYAVLDISEYWIVDPSTGQISLGILEAGLYEWQIASGSESIRSQVFPDLELSPMDLMGESIG